MAIADVKLNAEDPGEISLAHHTRRRQLVKPIKIERRYL